MVDENKYIIDSHTALKNPKDDKTQKMSDFAQRIAQGICEIDQTSGIVIALFGGWGFGKTTVLNFVKHYIQKKTEGNRPEVLDFNPWWFSESNELVTIFFSQILNMLKKMHIDNSTRKKIEGFVEVMSSINIPLVSPYVKPEKAVKGLLKMLDKDIYEQKKEIEKLLENYFKNKNKKILVIIDDIDRLDSEEIRQIFKLMKVIADFPNIIYLIALDKKNVVKALSEFYKEQSGENEESEIDAFGEQYLGKIIQIYYEIPMMTTNELISLFSDITSEFIRADIVGSEALFKTGIEHFLDSPRNIKKLATNLFLVYPYVRFSVDIFDFILIETLKIFCSNIYKIVRDNPYEFISKDGENPEGFVSNSAKALYLYYLENNVKKSDTNAVIDILSHLFPKFVTLMKRSDDVFNELNKYFDEHRMNEKRIFMPNNFNKYFYY